MIEISDFDITFVTRVSRHTISDVTSFIIIIIIIIIIHFIHTKLSTQLSITLKWIRQL